VKQTGGIEYTQQKMVKYRDEALAILNTFENIPVKNALEELVRFTTDRKF
jgi:octaprenyl-diphosphate synthase